MESIRTNVDQVCADFRSIKEKIVEHGVEVADGTPTSEYASKVDEVYEAGKDVEAQSWWDLVTDGGIKETMNYLFYNADFNTIIGGFSPPYTLKPIYAGFILSNTKGVKKITKEHIDFSSALSCNYSFTNCYDLEEIEEISVPNSHMWLFSGCTNLKSIGKFILKENTQVSANPPFSSCTALENISVEGIIPNSISFQWSSKLTRDSMLGKLATSEQIAEGKNLFTVNGITYYGGIFGALKNFVEEGLGNTATITLHATPKALLTDEEKLVVTDTLGWTIA